MNTAIKFVGSKVQQARYNEILAREDFSLKNCRELVGGVIPYLSADLSEAVEDDPIVMLFGAIREAAPALYRQEVESQLFTLGVALLRRAPYPVEAKVSVITDALLRGETTINEKHFETADKSS
jgi:hypothetical protein